MECVLVSKVVRVLHFLPFETHKGYGCQYKCQYFCHCICMCAPLFIKKEFLMLRPNLPSRRTKVKDIR